jgi:hypothetical protein
MLFTRLKICNSFSRLQHCSNTVAIRLLLSGHRTVSPFVNPARAHGLLDGDVKPSPVAQAESRLPLKVAPNFQLARCAAHRIGTALVRAHQAAMVAVRNQSKEKNHVGYQHEQSPKPQRLSRP